MTAVSQIISSLDDIQSLNDLNDADIGSLQALFADKQLHWLLQVNNNNKYNNNIYYKININLFYVT